MATVPTPATQTAGLVVPAATINSQGNLATYLAGRTESGGARRPLSSMRQTVAQSIPNTTITGVTFDAEEVDYDNGHSTVTNTTRYTAQTAGWYLVQGVVCFAANATGFRMACLLKNSAEVGNSRGTCANTGAGDVAAAVTPARLVFLNVADYVELGAYQNSTAPLVTNTAGATGSAMTVEWRSV